jgi:hypothetical protein
VEVNPVSPVTIALKLVIAQFVPYPKENEHTAGHTDSQARYVNDGKTLVFDQLADGDLEVVE